MRKPLQPLPWPFMFFFANTAFAYTGGVYAVACDFCESRKYTWSKQANATIMSLEYASHLLWFYRVTKKKEEEKKTGAKSSVQSGYKMLAASECATKQTRTETSHWMWTPKRICNHKVARLTLASLGSRFEYHFCFIAAREHCGQQALRSENEQNKKKWTRRVADYSLKSISKRLVQF